MVARPALTSLGRLVPLGGVRADARSVARVAAVVALFVAISAPAGDGRPLRWPHRPNVLVVVTDDQRADTLWAMPKTTALIAERGLAFANSVATTPVCCPSRATIYSGKYAHNHSVWDNQNTTGRLDTDETVQHVLGERGYLTAHVDRYLNNWREWTDEPRDFDLYAVQLGPSAWGPFDALVDGRRVHVTDYTTEWIGNTALGFLEGFERWDDARPWLMFVSTRAAHVPATPEPRYARAAVGPLAAAPSHEEDLRDKAWLDPTREADMRVARAHRSSQLRSLRSVDDLVERVIGRLGELGELRDTLILYTSDNGDQWGEHEHLGKRWPYDESLRVPMLLRWDAGGLARGTVRTDVVGNVDVAPTIYDVTGVSPGYPVDGHSLLGSERRHAILIEYRQVVENPDVPTFGGVWTPEEVFLRFPAVGDEFYARGDPYQLRNLLARQGRKAPRAYLRRLERWRQCAGASCP